MQCVLLLILFLYVSNFTFQPRLESISRNQSTFIDVSRFGRRYSYLSRDFEKKVDSINTRLWTRSRTKISYDFVFIFVRFENQIVDN